MNADMIMRYSVDLNAPLVPRMANTLFVSGDNMANTIEAVLTKDGKALDASGYTCVLKMTRPDGEVPEMAGQVDGNVLTVTMTRDFYAVPGNYTAKLKLINAQTGERKTVLVLYGEILDDGGMPTIIPGNKLPEDIEAMLAMMEELREATADSRVAAQEARDAGAQAVAIAQEAADTANQAAENIDEKVNEANAELAGKVGQLSEEMLTFRDISNEYTSGGYIDLQTARVGSSVDFAVVQNSSYSYIRKECEVGDAFVLTGTGAAAARPWCFTDENGIVLDVADNNNGGLANLNERRLVAREKGFFVSNVRHSEGYNLQFLANADVVRIVVNASMDQSLQKGGYAADAKMVGDIFSENANAASEAVGASLYRMERINDYYRGVTSAVGRSYGVRFLNAIKTISFVPYFVDSSGGTYPDSQAVTDGDFDWIHCKMQNGVVSSILLRERKQIGEKIHLIGVSDDDVWFIVNPKSTSGNAAFLGYTTSRLANMQNTKVVYANGVEEGTEISEMLHEVSGAFAIYEEPERFYKKNVVCFGDSRTWYDGESYNDRTKSEWAGRTCTGYQEQLRKLLLANVESQGVSGNTSAQICERVRAFDFTGYDAVLLEGGVNDFVKESSVTIGSIAPVGSEFDTTTVYGAWQSAVEYIMTNYPQVSVYMTIPAIAWTSAGLFPYDIAKIKGEVAELYHIPCLDLYKEGGINEINRDYFYADDVDATGWRLHFNDYGNKWIGERIAEFMKAK